MLNTIIEWFKNLDDTNKIAIVVPVGLAAIGGLFALFKWLFSKKDDSPVQQKTIKRKGQRHTAIVVEENKGNIAGRDVNLGIDGDAALNQLVSVSKEAGQSKNEIKHLEEKNEKLKDTIRTLEEQLAQRQALVGPGQQQTPQPTQEAKELAKLITENDGPYAQALKAIAEGNNKKADGFLDETQKIIDHIQQRKNEAQAKIYMARMQNASYAGRPRDALQWCGMLNPLVGQDSQILNEIAVVYYENAMYEEADPLMKRALAIDEASFGKDHPNVARDLNNLAVLYKVTNRLYEAEPLMKRALAIDEASFGKDHPEVAIRLNNLAQLYQATNRLSEAEPMMKRALAIDEASFGKNHPEVAIRLNNLAQLYKATNRLSEAEPLMKRALAIDEASFGKDHPKVAIRLNNLAQLYKATNRLSEAEPMMKRALAIDEASFGKDHPEVAIDLNNLAQLYRATNRLAEAEPLMKRALAIDEASFGKDHPEVARDLNNVAGLYQATNRLSEAEPMYKRAVEIAEKSLGSNHPTTITFRQNWDICRKRM
ncbi:MAG: tetratricopeptide repeat protein [Sedimentisphaerales bacterium]|jgi:tetratricopeptide (TPR) repeat protein